MRHHRGYRPAFPQLTVFLRSENDRLGPYPALLDTGGGATMVPSDLLDGIGAIEGERATMRSHFGERLPVQTYVVDLEIEDFVFTGLYVIGDDFGEEIVLGRNVLNKLPLFLDGPKEQTEVLDDARVKRLRERRE